MSVGKSLARVTVDTVSSVFGVAGALVTVVGDFAEGLVVETTKEGELMPRVNSELENDIKLVLAGMQNFQQKQDKIAATLESLTTNQSDLEKKLESVMARLAALEKSE